jgi:hypothetical protein
MFWNATEPDPAAATTGELEAGEMYLEYVILTLPLGKDETIS